MGTERESLGGSEEAEGKERQTMYCFFTPVARVPILRGGVWIPSLRTKVGTRVAWGDITDFQDSG